MPGMPEHIFQSKISTDRNLASQIGKITVTRQNIPFYDFKSLPVICQRHRGKVPIYPPRVTFR